MKEFKGTQGKWKAIEHSWSDRSIIGAGKTIVTKSIYDECFEETQDLLILENEANFNLIATAPELLEALQHLLYTAEKLWDNQKLIKDSGVFTVTHPIIEEAKSVINKALGL